MRRPENRCERRLLRVQPCMSGIEVSTKVTSWASGWGWKASRASRGNSRAVKLVAEQNQESAEKPSIPSLVFHHQDPKGFAVGIRVGTRWLGLCRTADALKQERKPDIEARPRAYLAVTFDDSSVPTAGQLCRLVRRLPATRSDQAHLFGRPNSSADRRRLSGIRSCRWPRASSLGRRPASMFTWTL